MRRFARARTSTLTSTTTGISPRVSSCRCAGAIWFASRCVVFVVGVVVGIVGGGDGILGRRSALTNSRSGREIIFLVDGFDGALEAAEEGLSAEEGGGEVYFV